MAGLSFGIAFCIRFHTGIIPFSLALYYIVKKDFYRTLFLSLGVCFVVIIYGIFDYFIWGEFFHSPIEYVRINLFEGVATKYFGKQEWYFYFNWLKEVLSFGLFLPLIFFSLLSFRFVPTISISLLSFFLLHQLSGHKEGRFLLPIIPYIFISFSVGHFYFVKRFSFFKKKIIVFLSIILLVFVTTLGNSKIDWRKNNDKVFPFHILSKQDDVKGVLVVGIPFQLSTGYFYLRRNVPIFFVDAEKVGAKKLEIPERYNYIVNFSNLNIKKSLEESKSKCFKLHDFILKCVTI